MGITYIDQSNPAVYNKNLTSNYNLMKEDKILQKLNKIDQGFDKIDQKFASIDQRFVDIEEQLSFICEHALTREEYLKGQDQILTLFKRLDEDRVFTHSRIRRVEDILAI